MPHRLTLTRLREMLRTRRISPVEAVEAHLKQIDTINPRVNAFIAILQEEALAAARLAWERQGDPGRLHGVPFTVKDSFDIEGLPTLCGSAMRRWHRAKKD